MTEPVLLPPASTRLERAFVGAGARIDAVLPDVAALWNPATCPIALLPWLAWGLSTDRWDPDWSDEEKRAAVANAIAVQRIKGSRASVEAVLESFDALLELVEWFEATPQLDPYTFEVRLPLIDGDGVAGGTRVSAAFARAIVAEVTRTKPARAHFQLIQRLELAGALGIVAGAQVAGYRRLDFEATDGDVEVDWDALLQDENGEPLEFGDGEFVDGGEE